MAEPPYGVISNLLKKGRVVPFLGAGVNFGMRQPPDATWDKKSSTFLPSGADLSRLLARNSSFPNDRDAEGAEKKTDPPDLAKVASYYVEATGRDVLRDELKEIFNRDFEPCDIHHYLAQDIPAPILIVTTNYDDLTEQAFRKAGKPFDLVVHPTDREECKASVLWWPHGEPEPQVVQPNQLIIDLETTNVIYKMHGTIDRQQDKWHSYVITEEDYVDFLSRMTGQTAIPAHFIHHFRTHHFLFMGYGLNDWNLRVVLKNLRANPSSGGDEEDQRKSLRSWAIQYGPSELEKELWKSREVNIYDVDINEFVKQLREHSG